MVFKPSGQYRGNYYIPNFNEVCIHCGYRFGEHFVNNNECPNEYEEVDK